MTLVNFKVVINKEKLDILMQKTNVDNYKQLIELCFIYFEDCLTKEEKSAMLNDRDLILTNKVLKNGEISKSK